MKKKFVAMLLVGAMVFSFTACGSSTSKDKDSDSKKIEETVDTDEEDTDESDDVEAEAEEATDVDEESEETIGSQEIESALDMDKCISDLRDNLSLEPDYTFVQDYYIGMKDNQITITAVVDDATDPNIALDFADTLVRQLNLYAQMQDSSIESASKDFYGGLYQRYNALVGVAPASKVDDSSSWFVYDGIVGGKVMLKLNKAYR